MLLQHEHGSPAAEALKQETRIINNQQTAFRDDNVESKEYTEEDSISSIKTMFDTYLFSEILNSYVSISPFVLILKILNSFSFTIVLSKSR